MTCRSRRAAGPSPSGPDTSPARLVPVPYVSSATRSRSSPINYSDNYQVEQRCAARGRARSNIPTVEGTASAGRFGAVPLQADDLVLPSIERKGRPTPARRITREHLPVAAGHSLMVLRPREILAAAESTFYEHDLGSARLREVIRGAELAGSLRLDGVARAPLPVPDDDLVDALRQLDSAEAKFAQPGSTGRVTAGEAAPPATTCNP